VDEGVDYADKLRASGVAVDLEIYRGVTHEFIKMGRAMPEARKPMPTQPARCAKPLEWSKNTMQRQ
jgi:acetyl esterase/lipase